MSKQEEWCYLLLDKERERERGGDIITTTPRAPEPTLQYLVSHQLLSISSSLVRVITAAKSVWPAAHTEHYPIYCTFPPTTTDNSGKIRLGCK